MFEGNLTCGKGDAYQYAGIVAGDCPVTACIVRWKGNTGPFGSLDF